MSDQNISATPYPFYATGGDDDSVQQAVLTSHAGASVERNQDSQFSAARSQFVHRDVVGGAKDAQLEALRTQLAVKDSEIRALERHSEVKAELAAFRADTLQRDISSLRDGGLTKALDAIAKKLGL